MDQPENQFTQQPTETALPEVPVVGDMQAASVVASPDLSVDQEPTSRQDLPNEAIEPAAAPRDNFLIWQASEYIEHDKSKNWYVVLGVITVVLVLVAIFWMKQITFALLVVVMAIAVGIWAKRPAMQMSYRLDYSGIAINDKHFPYRAFRAFGVAQEGAFPTVVLIPVKRFSPSVTVHFPTELGEQIVDVFGSVLPMQEVKPDVIDSITKKLNF